MTTILGLIRGEKAVMGADGQVTYGQTVLKHTAQKIRKIYKGSVLVGFAGSAADSLALFERLEKKLEEAGGVLQRAIVELAKDWRQDKVLRRLEAILAVMNKEKAYIVSGAGDIIEPEDKIVALGSGGPLAYAACKALLRYSDLSPEKIVIESIKIASEIDIFTNDKITLLVL